MDTAKDTARQIAPSDRAVLAWLNRDAGERVFSAGGAWYSRDGWGMPHRRHASLLDAAIFCMNNRPSATGAR